jgi:S-formylglutathione hydrolase FrmB
MKTRLGLIHGSWLLAAWAAAAGSPAAPPAAIHVASTVASAGVVVHETVHSPALAANLFGDSPDRPVAIYLPPGYRSGASRYPVVYLLHGFGSTKNAAEVWTKGDWANVPGMMDRLIAAGKIREMIVVMPDASTRLGGAFYTNSAATGNWEDFITRDLVGYVDGRYRTLRRASSRAIAGHSMGGYGAIKIAMKHPDTFGAVYGLSACCMEWNGEMSAEDPAWDEAVGFRSLDDVAAAQKFIDDSGGDFRNPEVPRAFLSLVFVALSAAWSPDPGRPPFHADLLVEGSGDARKVPEMRRARWSANMPVAMLEQYRSNLARLRAIAFDVGRQDEHSDVRAGARDFDEGLTRNGIAHRFEEYEGTHLSRIGERLETGAFPFLSRVLAFGNPDSAPKAKKRGP